MTNQIFDLIMDRTVEDKYEFCANLAAKFLETRAVTIVIQNYADAHAEITNKLFKNYLEQCKNVNK